MTYWAHSDPNGLPYDAPSADWQLLSDHLQNVAALAVQLAEAARPGDADFRKAAELAGYLHDFGKYTDCFQQMIRSGKGRCQHSAHGAAISFDNGNPDVALAIAGHHAGLPDVSGGTGTLRVRINETRAAALDLRSRASSDTEALIHCFSPQHTRQKCKPEHFDLHTRMLFSCLVDADRLDSARRNATQAPLLAQQRLATLTEYIDSLSAKSPEGIVKQARAQVFQDCLHAATYPGRLLSLTVPTGGGKTLAAMAFALKRAQQFPDAYRRVIVVIPYLSIIEQNAEVYSKVFGRDAILEHHSGSFDRLQVLKEHFAPQNSQEEEEGYRQASLRPETENWDAPLIVTTSVRFFESLFSNRPSDLRRVHNIARSIIILDEVQTLPRRLISPLLNMIRELSENWGCTFVFSTATQPAFEKPFGASPKDPRWPHGTIREIIREPAALQRQLKRVVIDWELGRTQTWPEIAARILQHTTALCVLNVREDASQLFDELTSQAGHNQGAEHFHLSTRMCAADRLAVIETIRSRLKQNLPCRVISTQLIEAGVDLDFSVAYRALGPLDAILQVAGRTDREGLMTAADGRPSGRLIVFRTTAERTPPNEYGEATDLTGTIARQALQSGQSIQTDSTELMTHFWNRYFCEGGDLGEQLQQFRSEAKFATLALNFEMISNRTLDVFVPADDVAKAAIQKLRDIGALTSELRRKLHRYTVGLQPYELERARAVLQEIRPDTGIYVAVDGAYSRVKGLKLELSISDNIV